MDAPTTGKGALRPGHRLWWLSYADDAGPKGVVLMDAVNFLHARARSIQMQLSPGGEVRGFPVPFGEDFDRAWPLRHRCLSRFELEAAGLLPDEEKPS